MKEDHSMQALNKILIKEILNTIKVIILQEIIMRNESVLKF
jgi:hypothetical protein